MGNNSKVSREQLIDLFTCMLRIRKVEEKANQLFLLGLIPGTIHLYLGEEACATGVMANLRDSDKVLLTHRPHGGAIAKGLDPKRLFSELLGRADGCTRGKGGSMHLVDAEKGIMPTIPIIGAGIPIAAGIAFANKQNKSDDIAVSFFGDGCSNIGAFHEGLNIATVMNLPVVFVCENNLYAVSTKISTTYQFEDISARAAAYGLPGVTVDGNDVEAVYRAAQEAVERARNGGGPTLVECKTYRQCGHSRTDAALYRPKEELRQWLDRDPIKLCREKLIAYGYATEAECDELDRQAQAAIDEAAEFAKNSPQPDPDWALENVYA